MLVVGHIPSAEERRWAMVCSRYLGWRIPRVAGSRGTNFLHDLAQTDASAARQSGMTSGRLRPIVGPSSAPKPRCPKVRDGVCVFPDPRMAPTLLHLTNGVTLDLSWMKASDAISAIRTYVNESRKIPLHLSVLRSVAPITAPGLQ